MLKQLDIFTEKTDKSELYSDLSVKIHGFIMSRIPSSLAESFHKKALRPFSIYTADFDDYSITRISALNEEGMSIFSAFNDVDKIRVFGTKDNIKILNIEESPELEIGELPFLLSKNKYKGKILTPSMYKSNGILHFEPNLSPYFTSVSRKIALFEGVEIEREAQDSAFEQLRLLSFSFNSESHYTGSRKIVGLKGEFDFSLPSINEDTMLIRLLLSYATFSGLGGQTPQGMGGFAIER